MQRQTVPRQSRRCGNSVRHDSAYHCMKCLQIRSAGGVPNPMIYKGYYLQCPHVRCNFGG